MASPRLNRTVTAFVAAFVIVTGLAAVLLMTSVINDRLSENAERQVVLYTEQAATNVYDRMYAVQDVMGSFTVQTADLSAVRPALAALKDRMGFSLVAFANMEGEGISASGAPFSPGSLEVEETALSQGKASYSPSYEGERGRYERLAQTPLYIDGAQVGALYAAIPLSMFDLSNLKDSYRGSGAMVLVDAKTGEVLSRNGRYLDGRLPDGSSLYDFLAANASPEEAVLRGTPSHAATGAVHVGTSVEKLREGVAEGRTCFFAAAIDGEPAYVCMAPVGTGRWYMGCIVEESQVRAEEALVDAAFYVGVGVVLLCLVVVGALGLTAFRRHLDERNVEAMSRLYQALSDSVDLAVNLYCPSDGTTTPIVAKAKSILGYAFEDLVGDDGRAGDAALSEEGRHLFDRIARGSVRKLERGEFSLFSQGDAGERWVAYSVSPLSFEDKDQLLVVMHDITAEKKTQLSMREAMLAAEAANSAKSEFLSRMSHEIRTPMNGILGMLQIMRGTLGDAEANERSLDKMEAASDHLLGIINDVLDLSKIESGAMTMYSESFSLSDVLDEVCALIQGQCNQRSQMFRDVRLFDDVLAGAVYLGDAARMRQMLLNLLSNSSKYTHPAGIVTLETRVEPSKMRGYHDATFRISDNGIGMEEEFLERVFEPFAMEGRSHEQGTGLGMPIVRNIVSLMGGTVEVRSQAGEGTTFAVAVPLKLAPKDEARADEADEARADGADEARADGAKPSVEGLRVLVAEDNDLNAEIACELLSQAGVVVDLARDGEEAVARFRSSASGTYDAILMDIQMPIMDGYEATGLIRGSGRADAASVPIVAMSANAFSEDVARSMEAGMNMHLSKPIDIRKVLAALAELTG